MTRASADMICPHCGKRDSQVIESTGSKLNVIRRRRKCARCNYRYTTRERIEAGHAVRGNLERAELLLTEVTKLLHAITRSKEARKSQDVGVGEKQTSAA